MPVFRPRSFTLRRLPRAKNRRRCVCRRWCARKDVDAHSQLPQGPGRDDRGVAPRRRRPAVQSRRSDATGQGTITVDGKALRGSRTVDTAVRHVMAACDQVAAVVLADTDVGGKTNEIIRFGRCWTGSATCATP